MSGWYPEGALNDTRNPDLDERDPDEIEADRFEAMLERADAMRKGEW